MTGAALLRTEQMTKRFGGLVAVDRLDLEVEEGAIHSIIGPNGAGKTTVFNCIMEFYTPDDGAVWFAGERIDGVTPDRVAAAGINRTYQNIRLFRNLTAIENILVGMHIHLKSTWYGAVFNTPATRDDEAGPMTMRAASSTSWACGGAATSSRATLPMASSAGSKSPGRSPPGHGC